MSSAHYNIRTLDIREQTPAMYDADLLLPTVLT
jgi:hypothetical protein